MELFALNEEVTALEAALSRFDGVARLPLLIPLAWQLRQRDHKRALLLADEAETLLRGESIDDIERQRGMARLRLVRGELRWLFGDLNAAENLANAAIATFERLGDRIGAGDGKWLLTHVCVERGDMRQSDEWLDSAIEDYRACGDTSRVDAATARSLLNAAFTDAHATAARLSQAFDPAVEHGAAIEAWVASARAIVAVNTGDSGAGIKYFLHAHRMAMACGQIRLAVVSVSNAADTIGTLGDLDTALEWVESALVLARSNGCPGMLGLPLMQAGNILRMLDRHADARAMLYEAQAGLEGLKNAQLLAIVSEYLGDLLLDIGEPEAALGYFLQAEEYYAAALEGPSPLLRCWRGQADALCRLAQPEKASAKLGAALALANQEGIGVEQIRILRVYADLYRQSTLPPPDGMSAPGATLHYLKQAMATAAGIENYIVPSELLDEVASAYAACGEYQMAYDNGKAAARTRDSQRLNDARNRAIAMQVRQETERARADAEHQRQLAETEARRAAALQESSATLETLGLIGREITASLNAEAVYATLYRHVNQLLDATLFSVYLLERDSRTLHGVFGIEDARPFPLIRISVDDAISLCARCARARQEFVIDTAPDAEDPNLVPGTLRTLSSLFAPLMIGERLLGVMSIQSIQSHAYSERERSIFRTLCAYGAIALDNAAAYSSAESARQQASCALEELRHTEAMRTKAEAARAFLETQLRESQKMEAIGTLAGGIAHDFNNILATILGNVELARQDMSASSLALESLAEIRKAGSRARDLVQQILSFSRRQPTERKPIALAPVIEESVQLLRSTLPARIEVDVHCDADLPTVLADATQIQQVLINLCTNAMHAIGERPGRIGIRLDALMLDNTLMQAHPALHALCARQPCHAVRLAVSDDGCGMDAAMLERIFEPFYTTRQVDEGTGLGLSVVHGIVQTHEGAIIVESQPGKGSTFTVYLPATVAAEQPLPKMQMPEVSAPASIAADAHGGKHILYLDDDESLVFLVSRLLERSGHRISGHTDQREALDALRADPNAFDLVVTDYNMPGMSGLDVARAVRTIRADLPVAIASGFIDETLQSQAEGAGVRELIFKANAVEELCEAFARLAQAVGKKR
ncbi:MAG: response regulator [Betaproteobacteria bacterium]|nr:response regulator [Betaproteobacteria bacterium]